MTLQEFRSKGGKTMTPKRLKALRKNAAKARKKLAENIKQCRENDTVT